jgi:tetratricopeptide (TPR) repeat protein
MLAAVTTDAAPALPALPAVPPELIRAALTGNLVVIVGAGAAAGSGLPGWKEILPRLLDEARDSLGPARAGLLADAGPWFATDGDELDKASLLREAMGEDWLRSALVRALGVPGPAPGPVHRALVELPGAAFITTGYDDLLERALAERAGRRPRVLLPTEGDEGPPFGPGDVLKLCGDVEHPGSIVLTSGELSRLGETERAAWSKRLESLLQPSRQVLLIGVAHRAPELPDVLDLIRAARPPHAPGPFWLEVATLPARARAGAAGLSPIWLGPAEADRARTADWIHALAEAIRAERARFPMVMGLASVPGPVEPHLVETLRAAEAAFRAQDFGAAGVAYERLTEDLAPLLDAAPEDEGLRRVHAVLFLDIGACMLNLGQNLEAREMLVALAREWSADLPPQGRAILAGALAQLGELGLARALLPDDEAALSDEARVAAAEARQLIDVQEGRIPGEEPASSIARLAIARRLLAVGRLADAAREAHALLCESTEHGPLTLYGLAVLVAALGGSVHEEPPEAEPVPVAERGAVIEAVESGFARLVRLPLTLVGRAVREDLELRWGGLIELPRLEQAERDEEQPGDEPGGEESEHLGAAERVRKALATHEPPAHPWHGGYERARLLAAAGRVSEALAESEAAVRAFPGRAPLEFVLASLLAMVSRAEDALPHARAAFAGLPAPGYRLLLGQVLTQIGQAEAAWEVLAPLDRPGAPAKDARTLQALAATAERMALEKAPALWDRFLILEPNNAAVRLQRAKLAHVLGDEAAPDLAWRAWNTPGSEQLGPRAFAEIAEMQRTGPEFGEDRRERVRIVAAALAERFPGKPEAEHLRLRLLAALGSAEGLPPESQPGFDAADEDFLRPLPVDTAAARRGAEHQIKEEALQRYRAGRLSFEALCAVTGKPAAVCFLELSRGGLGVLSPPTGLGQPPVPPLAGQRLLVGALELLLIDALDLWWALRAALGAAGRLVVFADVAEQVRQPALAAGSVVQRALGAGIAAGWIDVGRQRPVAEVLPSLRSSHDDEVHRLLYREPLARALTYFQALEDDPALLLVSADFFTASGLGKQREIAGVLDWMAEPARALLHRQRALAGRVLGLPALVRALPDNGGRRRAVKLATLGFVDALDPLELLELLRKHRTKREQTVLGRVEWIARSPDHAGAIDAQSLLGNLYARSAWEAMCGAGAWSNAEGAALVTTLLGRAEDIDEKGGSAVLDGLFLGLALQAAERPQASTRSVGASAMRLSMDSPAAQLWQTAGDWAGSSGRRRGAFSRGVRQALLALDGFWAEGGPSRQLTAPLTIATQQSLSAPQITQAVGALAILSTCWLDKPLREMSAVALQAQTGETRTLNIEELLDRGASQLGSETLVLREDLTSFAYAIPGSPRSLTVTAHSEALLLRAEATVVAGAAADLAGKQRPHDGRAFQRLDALAEAPMDPQRRRAVARGAVAAPWRLFREDPAVFASWATFRPGGLLQTVEDLQGMLSEPGPLPAGKDLVTVLSERSHDAWSGEHGWELLVQASEAPGVGAALLVGNRLGVDDDEDFAHFVSEALWWMDHPADAPAGRLSWSIVFLRAAAAGRPRVALADGLDLRTELPRRLQRLLGEVVAGAAPPSSLAAVEPGLLQLSRRIVGELPGAGRLPPRDLLWLTYRLYAWLCSQLDRLSATEQNAGLESLARSLASLTLRIPLSDLQRVPDDAFDPAGFDRTAGIDYRLLMVLHAITLGEHIAGSFPDGPRPEAVESVTSTALEVLLAELAERPLNEVERRVRGLGARPSCLDWMEPATVPDLALKTLLTLRGAAFFDLPEAVRLRWLLDLPLAPGDPQRAPWALAAQIVVAVVRRPRQLAGEARRVFAAWLRAVEGPPESGVQVFRRLGLVALFAAGEAQLEGEARAALLQDLGSTEAVDVAAQFFLGLAAIGPERIGVEAEALLSAAVAASHDPVNILRALGRVMVVSRSRPVVHAARDALTKLAARSPFAEDARVQDLLGTLEAR